jgi:hypothetical protein
MKSSPTSDIHLIKLPRDPLETDSMILEMNCFTEHTIDFHFPAKSLEFPKSSLVVSLECDANMLRRSRFKRT